MNEALKLMRDEKCTYTMNTVFQMKAFHEGFDSCAEEMFLLIKAMKEARSFQPNESESYKILAHALARLGE